MKPILSKRLRMPALDEMDQKGRLLYAVNGAAEILLTADEEGLENSLREAMELMAHCMEVNRIYIWQNKMINGSFQYIQQFEWLEDSEQKGETVRSKTGFSYNESIPEWEAKLIKGECINGPLSSLSRTEQERLGPYGIKSILVTPVYLRDFFWGFVSFDDCHKERTFTEDEVSILRSGSFMLASAMDRHEAAARMREADEHAKLMLDATPLCCSLWDGNINLIDCNAEVVSFYGLKDKQEYLDRFFELSPKYQPSGSLSVEKARENIAAAFRKGRAVFEWMHQMPDGTPVPAEVTLVRVKRGDEFIITGYTRDLRQYKKIMMEIEHKDNLLHTANDVAAILLQSGTDEFENDLYQCLGMIAEAVGADRMYIWKNYEKDGQMYSTQLYEWSEGAEPQQGGKYVVDIPASEIAPSWKEKLPKGQCINGMVRDQPTAERAHLFAQGVLSILVVPVFLRDQFWGFIGFDDCHRERVFSEVEEAILRSGSLLIANALLRNEMTNDIRAAVKEAQAASKAKSEFLARMSHEIRTPMNVIAGMNELIMREEVPAAIYEHVLSIKQASASMLSLVNDILDFSKIEAGSLDILSAEYSLTSLINNILIIVRMKVSEKPILFTANIDCNIPNRLIGDETRFRQILLNVLDNAAKYTNEGFVSLTVTGELIEDTVVLKAEVSDSGIGIKKEDMDKLFDDFVRFDSERNRSVQGTGLGLVITKSLCQAMGGSIDLRSEYGVGSTFTITMPQKIKSYDEKFAQVSDPGTIRVLLYETRPLCADSILRSFDDLGVSCTWAKSKEEFYKELKNRSYPYVFVSSLLSESAGQIIKKLDRNTTLVLLTEFGEAPAMHNVRTIATPVHSASIANILDDIEDNIFYNDSGRENVRFIATAASILVVDDLNTNLKVAQGLMLPYQMQVDICGSGEEAIEYIQKKQYDIIFMDHMMPGIDGIEATRRIRSLEDGSGYYERVPIIALTANAISGVKEMFLRNGMNDFLAKPIDVTKLHGLLDKWIPDAKKEKTRKKRMFICSPVDDDPVKIKIEGIDVKAGIAMIGGTVESYLKMLAIYHIDGLDKIKKIRECVEKNDIKLYTIYVHSLKSASASIGAHGISDLFKSLEIAGSNEDIGFINVNTEPFLEEFETLLKNISVVISENRSKPTKDNDSEFLREELSKLREALHNRDAGEVDDIMGTLETVMWDQHTYDILKEISRNILLINYTDAVILVDKLLMS